MDASFLSGFVRGLTDEISTRRAETRKREDVELQRRQDVLNKLYDGVLAGDVRPEHFAQIVKDQMAVGEALAGPRKRKGTKGFFTGESDLSGPLGGLLDQILSGQMDIMEGEEGAMPLPATPDMGGVPAAPIPAAPGPRALSMPQAASPFAGLDMGGSLDIAPEQLPTPFNPPRFVDALQKPQSQRLSMMPPAPVPAPPRPALLVNKDRRARERAVADADVRRGIADADLNERIRAIEASPLAPEQKAAAIAAAYGAPASVGTTQEGDVIPDPASPTGFARVIWGVRNGQVQETGRIPAPAPRAIDDPDVIPPKEQAVLRAAGVQATRYSELTPEQQRALDAYEKRQRGTIPQPPVQVLTDKGVPAPPLPSGYRTALARVTSGSMSKDRKAAIEAEAKRLHAEGNTEELNSYLRQVALEGEPTGIRESQISRLDTVDALMAADATIKELERLGVPMNKVSGTAETLLNRLGTSGDPRLVSLGVQLETALMNYRRGITGAAFSASEAAQYDKIWPSFKNDISLNTARIDGLLKSMQTATSAYWTRKLGKQGAELVGALPKAQDYDVDLSGGR